MFNYRNINPVGEGRKAREAKGNEDQQEECFYKRPENGIIFCRSIVYIPVYPDD